jgi:hypothetical protein
MNALKRISRVWTGGATPRQVRTALALYLGASAMATAMAAQAFAVPANGSLGYDVYDVVVNQLAAGPIGYAGAIILMIWGASLVMKQWLVTVMCVIAGTVIIKAQAIVQSLGALVPGAPAIPPQTLAAVHLGLLVLFAIMGAVLIRRIARDLAALQPDASAC